MAPSGSTISLLPSDRPSKSSEKASRTPPENKQRHNEHHSRPQFIYDSRGKNGDLEPLETFPSCIPRARTDTGCPQSGHRWHKQDRRDITYKTSSHRSSNQTSQIHFKPSPEQPIKSLITSLPCPISLAQPTSTPQLPSNKVSEPRRNSFHQQYTTHPSRNPSASLHANTRILHFIPDSKTIAQWTRRSYRISKKHRTTVEQKNSGATGSPWDPLRPAISGAGHGVP